MPHLHIKEMGVHPFVRPFIAFSGSPFTARASNRDSREPGFTPPGNIDSKPIGFPSPRLENMVPGSRSEAHNYSSDRRPYIFSTYHAFSALSGPNVERDRSSRLTLTRQRKRPVYLILDIPPPPLPPTLSERTLSEGFLTAHIHTY